MKLYKYRYQKRYCKQWQTNFYHIQRRFILLPFWFDVYPNDGFRVLYSLHNLAEKAVEKLNS